MSRYTVGPIFRIDDFRQDTAREDDVYYLRSILGMLQAVRKGGAVDAENLADNIEWLAVFIAKLARAD